MIEYLIVNEKVNDNADNVENSYGICACKTTGNTKEIVKYTNSVFSSRDRAIRFIEKLNEYGLDPIHLEDVISDEKYDWEHTP